jgi:hypothetical protein
MTSRRKGRQEIGKETLWEERRNGEFLSIDLRKVKQEKKCNLRDLVVGS